MWKIPLTYSRASVSDIILLSLSCQVRVKDPFNIQPGKRLWYYSPFSLLPGSCERSLSQTAGQVSLILFSFLSLARFVWKIPFANSRASVSDIILLSLSCQVRVKDPFRKQPGKRLWYYSPFSLLPGSCERSLSQTAGQASLILFSFLSLARFVWKIPLTYSRASVSDIILLSLSCQVRVKDPFRKQPGKRLWYYSPFSLLPGSCERSLSQTAGQASLILFSFLSLARFVWKIPFANSRASVSAG